MFSKGKYLEYVFERYFKMKRSNYANKVMWNCFWKYFNQNIKINVSIGGIIQILKSVFSITSIWHVRWQHGRKWFCRENAILYSRVSWAGDSGLVNRASFPSASAFRIIARCILNYVSFRRKASFYFKS